MKLTVIGCSGSVPGPASPASCYLLQAPFEGRTFSLVLDLGSGAFGPLQGHLSPREIDAVALSHLHPDHCLDMTALYVARKYGPAGPVPSIPVHGPPGAAERMARASDLPLQPGMSQEFDFLDWDTTHAVGVGPFMVSAVRVVHPVAAYAVRIEHDGATLVYSGDTGPCEALTGIARGADVLLAEASFVESADNPPDLHLTGREAGEHARAAAVGRLLLTHIPPWTDANEVLEDARSGYDGPIELVAAGASYTV
ncbi:MAG: MBL fold metallo-hydrolase [Actinomycetota bacterium]|nr:MBL fold metallo-hydrolase [Actinomycetota bacterium]